MSLCRVHQELFFHLKFLTIKIHSFTKYFYPRLQHILSALISICSLFCFYRHRPLEMFVKNYQTVVLQVLPISSIYHHHFVAQWICHPHIVNEADSQQPIIHSVWSEAKKIESFTIISPLLLLSCKLVLSSVRPL